MSANRLARHLGLPRGENLYQIKRGNNNISRDVAVRIHSKFPQFSLLWLLTGWGVAEQRENELVALTLYDDLTDLEAGIPSRITLPRQVAGGAQVAVRVWDEPFGPPVHGAILLLRRYAPDEEPLYGNLHVVERADWRMVRTLCRGTRPGMVVLRAPADDECTVVPRRQIGALWLVTAMIGKTVR